MWEGGVRIFIPPGQPVNRNFPTLHMWLILIAVCCCVCVRVAAVHVIGTNNHTYYTGALFFFCIFIFSCCFYIFLFYFSSEHERYRMCQVLRPRARLLWWAGIVYMRINNNTLTAPTTFFHERVFFLPGVSDPLDLALRVCQGVSRLRQPHGEPAVRHHSLVAFTVRLAEADDFFYY